MESFLIGAIAMALFVAGLFFLRFWRETRDRLFLIFGIAFWLLALTRLALVVFQVDRGPGDIEGNRYVYWVRLFAFILILFAIIDKNRPRRTKRPSGT